MSEPTQNFEEQVSEGTQSVVQILHYLFWTLRILMVLLIVGYMFSGLFTVGSDENALVFYCGKLVGVKQESDFYVAPPKPIATHMILKVGKLETLKCDDFWYKEDEKNVLSDPSQQTNNGDQAELAPGKGGYLLTSDNNILHTKWEVEYSIADAKAYHKNYAAWEKKTDKGQTESISESRQAILFALRNSVLKTGARISINMALKDQQDEFYKRVVKEFTRQIEEMDIGVKIESVKFIQKQVPRATKAAFDEKNNADSMQNQKISEAQAYEGQVLQRAAGERARILAEARSYRQRIVNSIAADAAYLKRIEKEYELSGPAVLLTQYVEALTEVIENAKQITVVYPDQEVRVTLQPQPPENKPKEKTQPGSHSGSH